MSVAVPVALSLSGISRQFGRVMALDNAELVLHEGSVHALLGENGAGKTTLMRVAFGLIQPDAGTISVNGVTKQFSSPAAALAAGIGMVHQHFTLVPAMTVAENVALGGTGRYSRAEWAARVVSIGQRTGLVLNPAARVSDLSVGAQQRCEIVKALARDVRVLILDEPTAVLAPTEAQELLRWVRAFANEGHAVVLITHKLRDALAVADAVTVLRRGKTVLAKRALVSSKFDAAALAADESELAAAMLGDERGAGAAADPSTPRSFTEVGETARVGESFPDSAPDVLHAAVNAGTVAFQVTNADVKNAQGVNCITDATFEIRHGEIVGIAAIEGQGQHELLRLLAGRTMPTRGRVTIPSQVGFVPEDRHLDALMLDAPLVENIALRDAGKRKGRMPWPALSGATRAVIAEYAVRAGGEYVRARTLSGGNQQKLIVGRELSGSPSGLVVENPTRGLDFRAAAAVRRALQRARIEGGAVVVYSSDLDEVLTLADRVLVVSGGRVREVEGDREAVGAAMLGLAGNPGPSAQPQVRESE